jgi:hypothetical protein
MQVAGIVNRGGHLTVLIPFYHKGIPLVKIFGLLRIQSDSGLLSFAAVQSCHGGNFIPLLFLSDFLLHFLDLLVLLYDVKGELLYLFEKVHVQHRKINALRLHFA